MLKFSITSSVLIFFCTFLFAGEVDEKLHKECIYPILRISSTEGGVGSGVIIRSEKISNKYYKNTFLSCAHVAPEGVMNYEVKQYIYDNWSVVKDTKIFPAVFYAIDRKEDLAIGFFRSETLMPIAKLDFESKLFIGNDVLKVGCGVGDEPRLDYGKITSLPKNKNLRTSAFTVFGDSGCPLYHNYKVIGIMTSIRASPTPLYNISYAVTLDKFKSWSEENDNNLDLWDTHKKLPEMPFYYLHFKNYKIK